MKVVGISGTNGSGKDTIARMLRDDYGWYFADATTMLGEELTRRGLTHERTNKAALSIEWREQYGMGAMVDKGIERFQASDNEFEGLVVSSLRHPGEVDRVHALNGVVIWVDADPQVRFARISSVDRGRVEDKKTYEQFLAEQEAEMHGDPNNPAALKISAVKERADIFIENDSDDIEAFKERAIAELKKLNLL